jgi:hypothetical protein
VSPNLTCKKSQQSSVITSINYAIPRGNITCRSSVNDSSTKFSSLALTSTVRTTGTTHLDIQETLNFLPTGDMYVKSCIFGDITPCSPLKFNLRFGGICRLQIQGRGTSWFLAQLILLIMKNEATCSSETAIDFQRTTRRYIPEDKTLHNHRCENLKSYMYLFRMILTIN